MLAEKSKKVLFLCGSRVGSLKRSKSSMRNTKDTFLFSHIVLQICRFFANLQVFCAIADILHICGFFADLQIFCRFAILY